MATQAVTSGAANNNGGTIFAGGAASHTVFNVNKVLDTFAVTPGYGNSVVQAVSPDSSGNLGTFKPYAAGTFQHTPDSRDFLIRRSGSKISGVDTNLIKFTAADKNRGDFIYSTTSDRAYGIASWDYVTGVRTTYDGIPGSGMSFGADNAATPTRAIPGELTYMVTGKTPTNSDYKPITG